MRRVSVQLTVARGERGNACAILAQAADLPKLRVKEAMRKGAVWLKRAGSGERRLRRAQALPRGGDVLSIYYDADLLARVPPGAECRHDASRFSIWFKPAGLMTQGTRFGDHCSLLRQAEVFLRPAREAFMVHRLDREAAGLVIIAHDRAAAGDLSRLFTTHQIVKRYRVEARGPVNPAAGRIERPLNGKPAVTEYTVIAYDSRRNVSALDLVMRTGRKHQIRRHLALAGFPVMGDPLYGKNNQNSDGLKLWALGLEFTCPFTGQKLQFHLPADGAR